MAERYVGVIGCGSTKEDGANPLPFPRKGQYKSNDNAGNEVNEQGRRGLPEAMELAENIERKQAEKDDVSDAQQARGPEQGFSSRLSHSAVSFCATTMQSAAAHTSKARGRKAMRGWRVCTMAIVRTRS